jgi:hypothetical protein
MIVHPSIVQRVHLWYAAKQHHAQSALSKVIAAITPA